MANTLFSAIKVYLEAQGLGINVYRDAPPPGAVRPYVVMIGDIGMRLEPLEDGTVLTGSEEIQIDLFETWRDAADKSAESTTLADAITLKLQGTPLSYGTNPNAKRVYGLIQRNRTRLADRNERVTRHLYQFDAVRSF